MQQEQIVINVRSHPQVKSWARQIAKRDGMTVSAWVRHQIIQEARRLGIAADPGRQSLGTKSDVQSRTG